MPGWGTQQAAAIPLIHQRFAKRGLTDGRGQLFACAWGHGGSGGAPGLVGLSLCLGVSGLGWTLTMRQRHFG